MSRIQYWAKKLISHRARRVLEIGVYRGAFARQMLDRCPSIEKYYLIDPWRSFTDAWNDPLRGPQEEMDENFRITREKLEAHAHRIEILRGTTLEVIDQIPDESLDFIYVDGDHTLRGITIDMVKAWPKLKPGGTLGGDDYGDNQYHNGREYDPTEVKPFVDYFAEAVGAVAEPARHRQFIMHKPLYHVR